jgi:hypothetical protein
MAQDDQNPRKRLSDALKKAITESAKELGKKGIQDFTKKGLEGIIKRVEETILGLGSDLGDANDIETRDEWKASEKPTPKPPAHRPKAPKKRYET